MSIPQLCDELRHIDYCWFQQANQKVMKIADDIQREHNRQMYECGLALKNLEADRDNWRRQALDENAVVDKLKEVE